MGQGRSISVAGGPAGGLRSSGCPGREDGPNGLDRGLAHSGPARARVLQASLGTSSCPTLPQLSPQLHPRPSQNPPARPSPATLNKPYQAQTLYRMASGQPPPQPPRRTGTDADLLPQGQSDRYRTANTPPAIDQISAASAFPWCHFFHLTSSNFHPSSIPLLSFACKLDT